MKLVHTLPVTRGPDPRVRLLRTMIVALCAALVACQALAQEGAPASGNVSRAGGPGEGAVTKGPADGAAMTNHGIDPVTPQRGYAGLQRRANLKALIAGAPGKAVGLPAVNTPVAPSLMHPGTAGAVPRNTIGIAMPGVRSPGHNPEGVTTQAGTRLTGPGSAAGNVANTTHQLTVPASAGPALYGAGLNGTTIGRMAFGPGSIGGPVKDRSGINGTLMRPKH